MISAIVLYFYATLLIINILYSAVTNAVGNGVQWEAARRGAVSLLEVWDLLLIAASSVFTSESGQASVWVVDPDVFRIEQRAVSLSSDGNGMATVLEGLQAGERVVGTGVGELRSGMTVRPFRVGMLSE